MGRAVELFEVGPRDGLQNESRKVPSHVKVWFISELARAGFRNIEAGLFVRSDRVPQMKDTEVVLKALQRKSLPRQTTLWSLVPNQKGLERAFQAQCKAVAVFTAVTETFVRKNIGMSLQESLRQYSSVVRQALKAKLKVRGYLSTAFGCPYEGKVSAQKTLKVIEALMKMGVHQVSIGDTIGVADPKSVEAVIKPALRHFESRKIAVHFHDTRGGALANSLRALELGVRVIDSSAGGLGGCPFAPGASGNLASEDLIYHLHRMGIQTEVNLRKLAQTSLKLSRMIKRPLTSRYLQAYASDCKRGGILWI